MNKYQKIDKKLHQDSSSDAFVVQGRSKNKNQDGWKDLAPNPKSILKRKNTPIVEKGPLEERLYQTSQRKWEASSTVNVGHGGDKD